MLIKVLMSIIEIISLFEGRCLMAMVQGTLFPLALMSITSVIKEKSIVIGNAKIYVVHGFLSMPFWLWLSQKYSQ